ncbi:MAG: type IX secretion system protein PorQ [Rhodothermales bacterium]|nr:type IX secretion system protein PorQ [Rhodothermales bacterium]
MLRTFSIIACLSLATSAFAQVGQPTAFSFLRLEPSATSASLGGSVVASATDDISSFLYNPARLTPDMAGNVSLTYLNHLADVNSGLVAYVYNSDKLSTTFGGAIRYMSWGTIKRTDELGIESGDFNASGLALTANASRAYDERTRYGASVHLIHSGIDTYGATALAFDLGLQYQVASSGFTAGASLSNAGVTLSSLGSTSDDLPVDLRIGASKQLQHLPLLVSVGLFNLTDFEKINEDASRVDDILHHLAIGGEFQFGSSFDLRFGYNHRRHDELKTKTRLDFAGFAMGAGIVVRKIRVDYARTSWSESGSLNQFTVTTRVR